MKRVSVDLAAALANKASLGRKGTPASPVRLDRRANAVPQVLKVFEDSPVRPAFRDSTAKMAFLVCPEREDLRYFNVKSFIESSRIIFVV